MEPVTGLMIVFLATLTGASDLNFDFQCPDQPVWSASTQSVTCGNFKLDASKNKCTPIVKVDSIHLNCELDGVMKITCPGGVESIKIVQSPINTQKKMYTYSCNDASITAPGNLRLVPRSDK